MTDYNVSLGKGKDVQQLSSNDLYGGIKKEDIKDEQMKSIFSMLDADNNGRLDESEIAKINDAIAQFSQEDGDVSNLSKKEAKHLISSLGLNGIKAEDLFKFLGTIKSAASNIPFKGELTYDVKTDREHLASFETRSDGMVREFDQDGYELKGEAYGDSWKCKYNQDGSYTRNYDNGQVVEIDRKGREVGGKSTYGATWGCEYNEDGSFTRKYDNGGYVECDKYGRELNAKDERGNIVYTCEYSKNGDKTTKYNNKTYEIIKVDKNGNQLYTKKSNGDTIQYTKAGTKIEDYANGDRKITYKDGHCVFYPNSHLRGEF